MFASDNRAFVADQWHGSSRADYAMAARGAARVLQDVGVTYRPLPYYFRIDPAEHAALVAATQTLVDAQDKLLAHLCSTRSPDELVALFRVPPAMAARMDWPAMASSRFRMLRADIIPTDDGYWFCELNHFSGVGAGESYHSGRAFAELLGRPVRGVSPFRDLAHLYVEACRRDGLGRIVILDSSKHRHLGYGRHQLLQDYLRLMAPDIEVAYHDEQDYPTAWLEPAEASRTLVHRIVTVTDTDDDGAYLSAVHDSGATVTSMFEAELKMHRAWFSLLCDERHHHLLDDAEVAVIRRHVPHTFDLSEGSLAATLADKDDWVFKRSYSYGGEGVLIGAQCERDELRQALVASGVDAWTCQRFVPASAVDLPAADGSPAPHLFVLGMFVYGERANGLLVRASAESQVVNASRGGGVSWAFAE
jgi:hypothetical protein